MLPINVINLIKERKPFYLQNVIKPFFNWNDLESILNFRPILTTKTFHILSKKGYSWNLPYWSKSNSFPVDILKEELKHHVCYLSDASRINKTTNTICSQLEKTLNYPTDSHIYFSFVVDDTTGFGIHNDISDNLIIQMEGKTNIKIWQTPCLDGTKNISNLEEEPFIDVIMFPGDVVYIPTKYWHAAYSRTPRMSISFPIATEYEDCDYETRDWLNIEDYV